MELFELIVWVALIFFVLIAFWKIIGWWLWGKAEDFSEVRDVID